jgi:hypothetical protein
MSWSAEKNKIIVKPQRIFAVMTPAQKLFHCLPALLISISIHAQKAWPSPEIETMYRNGEKYISMGNLKDAVITFRQGVLLAPANMLMNRELAKAQYISGDLDGATATMRAYTKSNDASADDSCYLILALSESAQLEFSAARKAIKKGLANFPGSGTLFHELGIIYTKENRPEVALGAWIDGIEKDPIYPGNYYEASRVYLNSGSVLWGLLYGEIFLNISEDSIAISEVKKLLFTGYEKMFSKIAEMPRSPSGKGFEDVALHIFRQLTPVVSDGNTTENLIMMRTRFIMEWYSMYVDKYPFSLFKYQDKLIRTGHFDIYNEWLFGRVEGTDEFEAWKKFHEGDLERFAQWRLEHPITVVGEHYNARAFKGMFGGRKNRK